MVFIDKTPTNVGDLVVPVIVFLSSLAQSKGQFTCWGVTGDAALASQHHRRHKDAWLLPDALVN